MGFSRCFNCIPDRHNSLLTRKFLQHAPDLQRKCVKHEEVDDFHHERKSPENGWGSVIGYLPGRGLFLAAELVDSGPSALFGFVGSDGIPVHTHGHVIDIQL